MSEEEINAMDFISNDDIEKLQEATDDNNGIVDLDMVADLMESYSKKSKPIGRCKDCKHSSTLGSYDEESKFGLLFCSKINWMNEEGMNAGVDYSKEMKKGSLNILRMDSGEGVEDCVIEFVHEDFGCIKFEEKV